MSIDNMIKGIMVNLPDKSVKLIYPSDFKEMKSKLENPLILEQIRLQEGVRTQYTLYNEEKQMFYRTIRCSLPSSQ